MKFWKRIFFYSVTLFIVLFNCSGVVLIETIYKQSMDNIIKASLGQYDSLLTTLYLNIDNTSIGDEDFLGDSERYIKLRADNVLNRKELLVKNNMNTIEIYNDNNELISGTIQDGIPSERKELTELQGDDKLFLIREINNEKYLFISSRMKILDCETKIVASKNINEVYESKSNNYKLFFMLDITVCAILAIGMYLLSRNLTKPIERLTDASADIANGNYSKRVALTNKDDELEVLAKNFNSMLDVIEENIEELKEMNDSKQRFINSLTHEIKTPITSIIGYSDLLLKSKVSEEVSFKALNYINSESRRLESLNSTLLKLILMRKEELNIEEVSIIEIVNEACKTLTYKAEDKNIKLERDISDEIVRVDKQLVGVLLTNIIDNGIKASDINSKIIITGECNSEKNIYLVIIKDYGCGIPKEDLNKVLEPFYMVDKARDRKKNGAGLGLSICSKICELLNVGLNIKSEINEGTEVYLEFKKER